MRLCTADKMPQSTAISLYETAYQSFNNALHTSTNPLSIITVKDTDIKTSMQLLKKWLLRDMDKLLHEGLWLKHDDLKNNKSSYLEILYNAFADICNEHKLRRVVDKSLFKGKLNYRRTEIRKKLSYGEKRDSIMKQIMNDLYKWIIRAKPQKFGKRNCKRDTSSIMTILKDWLDDLSHRHYYFGSGDKNNRLRLNDIILDDIEWFRDKLMTGQCINRFASEKYFNGRKVIEYPCAFDVICDAVKEAKYPYPEDDMSQKALMKLLIKTVYDMGYSEGHHDGHDSY